MSIAILAPGWQTSEQDGGRHGFAALGVGASGAMDDVSRRLANLLVGNADDAAALEITLRGPRLRFDADCVVALTGAPLDGLPMWRPVALRAGTEISFGTMQRGAYAYLAVAGGIGGEAIIASRSTDIAAGLGQALAAGDELPFADEPRVSHRELWRRFGSSPSKSDTGDVRRDGSEVVAQPPIMVRPRCRTIPSA